MAEPAVRRDGEAALAAAVERLARLVRLESPSGDVPRLAALRDVLADRLAELGGAVELVPGDAGDHIRAAFPGAGRAGPAPGGHILVVGHYDTVWEAGWLASHPFVVRDLVATGPGVLDMKGGIVALEFAFELLRDSGRALAQPVRVVLVADEEVSSPHGRTAVMDAAAGAAAAAWPGSGSRCTAARPTPGWRSPAASRPSTSCSTSWCGCATRCPAPPTSAGTSAGSAEAPGPTWSPGGRVPRSASVSPPGRPSRPASPPSGA